MFNAPGSTLPDPATHAHCLAEPKPLPSTQRFTPLFRIDPGWLFLLSGLVLIASVLLIPAQHDLDDARWQLDRALAIEAHRKERLKNYGSYLAALQSDDEAVLLSLAAIQLNQSPANRIPIGPMPEIAHTSASVFPALEPGPVNLPPRPSASASDAAQRLSILERLTINNSSRLWIIAGGTMCVLFGLLPGASKSVSSSLASAAVATASATLAAASTALREANQSVAHLRSASQPADPALSPHSPTDLDQDLQQDIHQDRSLDAQVETFAPNPSA